MRVPVTSSEGLRVEVGIDLHRFPSSEQLKTAVVRVGVVDGRAAEAGSWIRRSLEMKQVEAVECSLREDRQTVTPDSILTLPAVGLLSARLTTL